VQEEKQNTTHAMSVLYAATSASKSGSTSSDTGAFFEMTWRGSVRQKMEVWVRSPCISGLKARRRAPKIGVDNAAKLLLSVLHSFGG